jgi:medium-chain acyl-[acyl-carrier-protein] hydrolase
MYRLWSQHLPPQVEVCPIQLPGRENRIKEQPFTQIAPLLRALIPALRPYLDVPFQIFGHSMGTLLSFELVRELRRQGLPQPTHLFVSGCRAPQVLRTKEATYSLPNDEFLDSIKAMGGTPEAVLQNQELMELLLPVLRADFEIVETYEYHSEPPLSIPIAVFGGREDREVPQRELEPWQQQTTRAYTLNMFPGGHFYLHPHQKELLQTIATYYL